MREVNGWDFLLVIGTFTSIYTSLIMYGSFGVNGYFSTLPMVLWVGAYELSKHSHKQHSAKEGKR